MSLTVKLVTSYNSSYYIKRSAQVDTLVIGLTADTNVNKGAFLLTLQKQKSHPGPENHLDDS